ncbi:MAG: beta-propeller domain-containing protein [Acidimicrobiaceae bacterium]|nr:beta-propeller domain-containing protein [Acidimicrobiaceae bacterium]
MSVRGSFRGARRIGGVARVVTSHSLVSGLPYSKSHQTSGSPQARAANRDAVLGFTLKDWLPEVRHNGVAVDAVRSCDNIYAPASFSGFGTTTVLTIDMEAAFDTVESVTIMAPGDTVYGSSDSLYVTTTNWQGTTDIHRFAVVASGSADYVASGEVPGYIRNEHSVSEHEGYLRVVATTLGPVWDTSLRVLRHNGALLEEVGAVGDIGRGERVHAVRFAGDVAYVATAGDVDLLHTIDLTEPSDPKILDELSLPGMSSYLHLIGNGMVLSVGGAGFGADVLLLDAGEPAALRELARWRASDYTGGYGSDHRRFLWWPSKQMLVIPLYIGASEDRQGSVVALRVQPQEVVEIGRVEHVPGETPPAKSPCRLITEDDLPVRASGEPTPFEETVSWLIVLACEPGEKGAPHNPAQDDWMRQPGFDVACDPEIPLNSEERAIVAQISQPNETINYCWTNVYPNQIYRSIAIDDELWTLSYPGGKNGQNRGHLEVNNIQTLQRLATLEL